MGAKVVSSSSFQLSEAYHRGNPDLYLCVFIPCTKPHPYKVSITHISYDWLDLQEKSKSYNLIGQQSVELSLVRILHPCINQGIFPTVTVGTIIN